MKTAGNEVTVTKKELIDRIAQQTGEKRSVVKRIVQEFLAEIIKDLGAGRRLEFRDFGVFHIHERKERLAQNPKTLQRVSVPRKKVVKFKPGRRLKRSLQLEVPVSPAKSAPLVPPLAAIAASGKPAIPSSA